MYIFGKIKTYAVDTGIMPNQKMEKRKHLKPLWVVHNNFCLISLFLIVQDTVLFTEYG